MSSPRKESFAILGLAVFVGAGLISIGCAHPEEKPGTGVRKHQKENVVLIRVEKAGEKWVSVAIPETLVICDWTGETGDQRQIIWKYNAQKLAIKFASDIDVPPCDHEKGECTVALPLNLLKPDEKGKTFKYTITGEFQGQPLEPNDPWVEVDR
jgi:hypothetical protein